MRFFKSTITVENKTLRREFDEMNIKADADDQIVGITIDLWRVSSVLEVYDTDKATIDPGQACIYYNDNPFYIYSPYEDVVKAWQGAHMVQDEPEEKPLDLGAAVKRVAEELLDQDNSYYRVWADNLEVSIRQGIEWGQANARAFGHEHNLLNAMAERGAKNFIYLLTMAFKPQDDAKS